LSGGGPHTHPIGDITNLQTTITGIQGNITDLNTDLTGKANTSHSHNIADINNLQSTLDSKATSDHIHHKDSNLETRAPVASDDNTQGYSQGSHWLDTSTGFAYYCIYAGENGAVWKKFTHINKSDVGLSAVPNTDFTTPVASNTTHRTGASNSHTQIDSFISSKGQVNGLATLDDTGKVPVSQLELDNVSYQGVWNSSTNTPTLVSGVGTKGHY